MFIIRLADLNIRIDNKYPFTEQLCKDYTVKTDYIDFEVSISEEQIASEQERADGDFSIGYCESICVYREICTKILKYDAFLMHAAVVEMDGEAYAFTAGSGTGKSTHVLLWLERFGERARIINGDKPIYRFHNDGKLYVYGTPWCGKEGFHINTRAPLKAIAFIERAEENEICKIKESEVIGRIFHQLLLPKEKGKMDSMLKMLDRMIKTTPCYLLKCNKEQEAAGIAYQGMVSD